MSTLTNETFSIPNPPPVDENDFSLDLKEYHFTLSRKGELTGARVKTKCVIRAFVGETHDAYFEWARSNFVEVPGEENKAEAKSLVGINSKLLSFTMYEIMADGTERLFSQDELQKTVPYEVLGKLTKKANEINGLDAKAEDKAKND